MRTNKHIQHAHVRCTYLATESVLKKTGGNGLAYAFYCTNKSTRNHRKAHACTKSRTHGAHTIDRQRRRCDELEKSLYVVNLNHRHQRDALQSLATWYSRIRRAARRREGLSIAQPTGNRSHGITERMQCYWHPTEPVGSSQRLSQHEANLDAKSDGRPRTKHAYATRTVDGRHWCTYHTSATKQSSTHHTLCVLREGSRAPPTERAVENDPDPFQGTAV